MSEKRFWFVIGKGKLNYVQDNVTNEKITVTELEDLLNELNEENDVLKQQLQTRYIVNKQYEELQRLKKENKELEEKKIELMECNALQYQEIKNWESENRILRKIIFLYEKGITMSLSKEEQMDIYAYVDLELRRDNDED